MARKKNMVAPPPTSDLAAERKVQNLRSLNSRLISETAELRKQLQLQLLASSDGATSSDTTVRPVKGTRRNRAARSDSHRHAATIAAAKKVNPATPIGGEEQEQSKKPGSSSEQEEDAEKRFTPVKVVSDAAAPNYTAELPEQSKPSLLDERCCDVAVLSSSLPLEMAAAGCVDHYHEPPPPVEEEATAEPMNLATPIGAEQEQSIKPCSSHCTADNAIKQDCVVLMDPRFLQAVEQEEDAEKKFTPAAPDYTAELLEQSMPSSIPDERGCDVAMLSCNVRREEEWPPARLSRRGERRTGEEEEATTAVPNMEQYYFEDEGKNLQSAVCQKKKIRSCRWIYPAAGGIMLVVAGMAFAILTRKSK